MQFLSNRYNTHVDNTPSFTLGASRRLSRVVSTSAQPIGAGYTSDDAAFTDSHSDAAHDASSVRQVQRTTF